jgi:hypothetical protein
MLPALSVGRKAFETEPLVSQRFGEFIANVIVAIPHDEKSIAVFAAENHLALPWIVGRTRRLFADVKLNLQSFPNKTAKGSFFVKSGKLVAHRSAFQLVVKSRLASTRRPAIR